MNELTQEYMREFFHYDPDTGVLTRIKKLSWKGNPLPCKQVPKSMNFYGYLQVNVLGKPRFVHRLVFLYMEGSLPNEDVDHIDGDRLNNRWSNLRKVNRQDNLRNMGVRPDNTSGVVGVSFAKDRNKWHSYIHVGNGKRRTLGHFESFDAAVAARKTAEAEEGYHLNHGGRAAWSK